MKRYLYNPGAGRLLLPVLCSALTVLLLVTVPASAADRFPGTEADLLVYRMVAEGPAENLEEYQNLSPEEKARLQKKLREWQSMSPAQREAMRRRLDQLRRMPPEARRLYRNRLEQWQRLSPGEQDTMRRKLEQWDSLSAEEKAAIRRRFQ